MLTFKRNARVIRSIWALRCWGRLAISSGGRSAWTARLTSSTRRAVPFKNAADDQPLDASADVHRQRRTQGQAVALGQPAAHKDRVGLEVPLPIGFAAGVVVASFDHPVVAERGFGQEIHT